jgi:hypothetical protein
MGLLATLLMLLSLTNTSSGGHKVTSVFKKLKLVTVHIFTSRNQFLLTFATLLGGLANGFTAGDFTSVRTLLPSI